MHWIGSVGPTNRSLSFPSRYEHCLKIIYWTWVPLPPMGPDDDLRTLSNNVIHYVKLPSPKFPNILGIYLCVFHRDNKTFISVLISFLIKAAEVGLEGEQGSMRRKRDAVHQQARFGFQRCCTWSQEFIYINSTRIWILDIMFHSLAGHLCQDCKRYGSARAWILVST